jgi:hypothetical protein
MEFISSTDQKTLNARYQNTALVVVALGASVVLYLVIGRVITPPRPAIDAAPWGQAFYLAALMIGLAVVAVRRLMLSRSRLSLAAKRGTNAVFGSLGTSSIIGAALGDVVGILGLVAYLMIGDPDYSWRLGVVGLLLIIYSFPRRGEWARAVSEATKDSNK